MTRQYIKCPTIFRIHLPPRDNVPRVDYVDVRAASREVAEEYVKLRWPELFAPPTLYGADNAAEKSPQ